MATQSIKRLSLKPKDEAAPVYTDAEAALKDLRELVANPTSFNHIQELINTILDPARRLVLYLGSGCSKSVRLDKTPPGHPVYEGKSWHELLEAMFAESRLGDRHDVLRGLLQRMGHEHPPPKPTLDDLLKYFDKLQVASFITGEFVHVNARNRAITDLVEPASTERRRSQLYEGLMCLPFDEIVTTNHDSNADWFLRHSCRSELSTHAEVFDKDTLVRSFSNKEDFRLIYLHGKAGQKDLVFDRFDYSRLMAERDGLLDFVTYLLRDSSTVYVGFGLDDPSFNLMEDRLYSLDREHRPISFALVPMATDKERELWGRRHLFLIEYGNDHSKLPLILEAINTIREFLIWAEPNRPTRVVLDADRTSTYLDDALLSYMKGQYAESLTQCRAALATTLFWQRAKETDKLSDGRARRLCQIRVRLALDHYKLRLSDETKPRLPHKSHFELIDLNLNEAEQALDHAGELSKRWLPYASSARLLRARLRYHEGHYREARDQYATILDDLSRAFGGPPAADSLDSLPEDFLDSLRSAEAYYYAVCQKSRLDYQLIEGDVEDPAPQRIRECEQLEVIAEEVLRLRDESERRCAAAPESSSDRQELTYLKASFERIAHIGAWTAGRHGVGIFRGAIPWSEERTEAKLSRLQRALALTRRNFGDGQPASGWVALRNRYLARGHVLSWLIQQHLDPTRSDTAELKSGYEALQAAFFAARGEGLERQVVLNLLEAARINTLVLFGERIRHQRGGRASDSGLVRSALTEAAGLYYLEAAFKNIDALALRGKLLGIHLPWLDALGSSLAAYYAMIVEHPAGSSGIPTTNDRLREVFETSADARAELVARKYELCSPGKPLGRISLFKRSYKALQIELGSPAP